MAKHASSMPMSTWAHPSACTFPVDTRALGRLVPDLAAALAAGALMLVAVLCFAHPEHASPRHMHAHHHAEAL